MTSALAKNNSLSEKVRMMLVFVHEPPARPQSTQEYRILYYLQICAIMLNACTPIYQIALFSPPLTKVVIAKC